MSRGGEGPVRIAVEIDTGEAGARKRKAVSLATLFGASPGIRRFPEADVGCWEFRGEILAAITVFLAILAAGRFVPPGKPFHRFSRSSLSPSPASPSLLLRPIRRVSSRKHLFGSLLIDPRARARVSGCSRPVPRREKATSEIRGEMRGRSCKSSKPTSGMKFTALHRGTMKKLFGLLRLGSPGSAPFF